MRWPRAAAERQIANELAAAIEQQAPREVAHDAVEVVLDDDHAVNRGAIDGGVQLRGAARVEVRGRLIQDQRVGPRGQRRGERDALLLAAREAIDAPRGAIGQPNGRQRFGDARWHLGGRHPQVLQAERHLVLDRQHGELARRILEDGADAFGQVTGRKGDGRATVDLDLAAQVGVFAERDQTGQAQAEGALARTARAGQQHPFARGDRERDVVQGRRTARQIASAQTLDAKHRARRVPGAPDPARSC